MKPNVTVSLIVATVGRSDELRRLLVSLESQTYTNFEVVVVDQNNDSRARDAIRGIGLKNLKIVNSKPGLSRARNVGIKEARGTIFGFPDDDCWYAPDTLERVFEDVTAEGMNAVIVGRLSSESGKRITPRRRLRSGRVKSIRDVLWAASSATLFVPLPVLSQVGGFDERLGLGAGTPWTGGEDIDFLLRVNRLGIAIVYDDQLIVYHPAKSRLDRMTGTRYGASFGAVLRKNRVPFHLVLWELLRSLGGYGLSLLAGDVDGAAHYQAVLRSKWEGWARWRGA